MIISKLETLQDVSDTAPAPRRGWIAAERLIGIASKFGAAPYIKEGQGFANIGTEGI